MARFTLIDETLAAAVTGVTPDTGTTEIYADYIALEAIFVRAAGGTTCKAYVQTSLDGTNWIDVACFAFTTTSANKYSALTTAIAPASQAAAPTDGALTDNTVINGVFGDYWRVKLTTTGTYSGASSIKVVASTRN